MLLIGLLLWEDQVQAKRVQNKIQSIIKNKATVNFENTGKKVINLNNVSLEKIENE